MNNWLVRNESGRIFMQNITQDVAEKYAKKHGLIAVKREPCFIKVKGENKYLHPTAQNSYAIKDGTVGAAIWLDTLAANNNIKLLGNPNLEIELLTMPPKFIDSKTVN